ncbi:MAG: protein kinase domain-containing protein [Chthoniobacterales bacterium]
MSSSSAAGEVCTSCGSRIVTTASGDLGCLSCLLRAGAEDEPDLTAATPQMPDSFGAYVIARHEDGSPHELGRGAMGITFLAEDVSLQRPVALKIIKADFGRGGSDARERFMREARAAAALRHPHVATVYQFGMDDETGQYFCAMELVEGETLEERVRRTGPLDSPTVVEIARQVTAALAAAEARGLVHRDLKPGNIMVASEIEDGKIAVKVIDFGVAKALLDAPEARTLTHGGFVGTPAFASPEQLRGKSIDVRSDIYSLGATMWFLLTGALPLGGGEPRENEDGSRPFSPRLEQLKTAHVPARLRSLLMTMLAAEPAARPGTRELADLLDRIQAQVNGSGKSLRRAAFVSGVAVLIGGGIWILHTLETRPARAPSNAPPKSIAVLPFENLSAEKENAYFANGMQDEILTRLSKIADLKVISRTSTQQFQSKPGNIAEIAQQLGVATILEGSVQKSNDSVRVNVQLIKADGDSHLWAETYDRKLTDMFAVESEIAQKVAGSLEATLTGREKAAIKSEGTKNPKAYDAFLHALALPGSQGPRRGRKESMPRDYRKSLEFLRHAVELDPDYAQAWAFLAMQEAEIYFSDDRSEAQKKRARTAAERALHLAPALPQAQAAMGVFNYYCGQDYEAALAQLKTAHAGAPNDAQILSFIGFVLRRQGRLDDGLSALRQAAILDPLNERTLIHIAVTLRGMRQFAEARAAYDRVQAIAPNDSGIVCWKAEIDLAQGDLETAWSVVNKPGISPADPCFGTYLTLLYFRRETDEMITQCQGILRVGQNSPPDQRARAHMILANTASERGDRAAALASGEQARKYRERMRASGDITPGFYAHFIEMEASLGNRAEVEKEIAELFEATRNDKWAFPDSEAAAAIGYTLLGDFDKALPLLQDALKQPSEEGLTPAYLRLDPVWDSVRNDPRFKKLAEAKQ